MTDRILGIAPIKREGWLASFGGDSLIDRFPISGDAVRSAASLVMADLPGRIGKRKAEALVIKVYLAMRDAMDEAA